MSEFLFDYATLRVIWWVLLGALFLIFAFTDGFDLGVAALSPFVTKKDEERRVLLNTVGPFWEGNQVWLVLAAGAIFAAWPPLYGVLFTGFYLPLFLVLASLILRPVGFKYRSKLKNPAWRKTWDVCLWIGGVVPSLCFGMVVGALVSGAYYDFEQSMHMNVYNNFPSLFHPLALCSALLWLLIFVTHGGLYLLLKTTGELRDRIQSFLPLRLWVSLVLYCLYLCVWKITIPVRDVMIDANMPSNPLAKSVLVLEPGNFWTEWLSFSPLMLSSLIAFALLTVMMVRLHPTRSFVAFWLNGLRMGVVLATVGLGNFPILIPSLSNANHSLTVWDASSSHLTLGLLLVTALVCLPFMIWLASWVYRSLSGPVKTEDVQKKSHELY